MSNLFAATFEDGALYHPTSGFEGMVVTGGSLECAAGGKHSGDYGAIVTPLRYYRAAGYRYAGTLTRFRQAFYLDPNSIAITDTRYIAIARNYHDDASKRVFILWLNYNNPNYQISMGVADNTGDIVAESGNHNITDDWHLIETDWLAAASGYFKLWIDGVLKETLNVNNSNMRIMYPALGVCEGPAYPVTGTFLLDNWRANNDGGAIGA